MRTEILLDHDKSGDGAAYVVRALLRIHGDAPAGGERVPLNVGVVLDRSGSMGGAPIEHAKEAAALLVRRLWPEDVVSVVAYETEVETIAEPATGGAQHDLVQRIRGIHTGGTTNLSGGWLRGRDLVARGMRDGVTSRLLLLTDGLANVGITDPAALVGLCRQAREEGITTTTIGFGPRYDEALLRRMAQAGGGSTYYIERPEQAPAVFGEEVEGLLSLCAQNLSVEIRPARAARLTVVHHRYPKRDTGDGLRLELGDLYARDPRLVLAEFVVRSEDGVGDVEVADLTLTAHVVGEGGGIERREIRLPIRASLADGPRVDPEVRRELLLQEAARAREAAYDARRTGEFGRARDTLRDIAERLSAYGADDAELKEEAEDLNAMAERFAERRVDDADAKYLFQRSYASSLNDLKTSRAISRIERARRAKREEHTRRAKRVEGARRPERATRQERPERSEREGSDPRPGSDSRLGSDSPSRGRNGAGDDG